MNPNLIGDRGEMIASSRLMEGGLFYVECIGGKVPTFDLLCAIAPQNGADKPYQFLVQVKGSTKANLYTRGSTRIKTPVPKSKLQALIDYPLPTYVAGVDLNAEKVYIAAAFDRNLNYKSSIPTGYCLELNSPANVPNLNSLKQDVIKYWQGLIIDNYKPSYQTLL
jgi:hypothetical protein